MSDDQHQEQQNADRWVDAAAAMILIALAIITFTYWAATKT